MDHAATLLESLPQAQRLALAYAPRETRGRFAGLLALDARLGGIVGSSREPMLAQLRLAWWREQLAAGSSEAARGEPLIAALTCWGEDRKAMTALVDAWEGMTGEPPIAPTVFERLAEARAAIFGKIVKSPEPDSHVLRMARNWALADIAFRLTDPAEQSAALDLARQQDWSQARLPRNVRPLAMLHALATRNLASGLPVNTLRPMTALAMIRIGLLTG
ncbi:MAG: hypothetical protein AB7F98_10610 [Novosphingobium sp.]